MLNFKTITYTALSAVVLGFASFTTLSVHPAYAHGDEASHDKRDNVTETFDFADFDKISITGVYELDVEVGQPFSVVLSGRASEMKDIVVKRDGDMLELGQKKKNKTYDRKNRKGIQAKISLPSLNALQIAGVGTGEIKGVESDIFELEIGGVGELKITGTCGTLDADVAGVGEITMKGLKCKTADISLAGVGEMSAYASETVDVSAAGVGSVDIYGGPKNVSRSKGFLSKVKIHD